MSTIVRPKNRFKSKEVRSNRSVNRVRPKGKGKMKLEEATEKRESLYRFSEDTRKARRSKNKKPVDDLNIPKLFQELSGNDTNKVQRALSQIVILYDTRDAECEGQQKDRNDFGLLGGPIAIVGAMRRHPNDTNIQSLCCSALQKFSSVDHDACNRVISVGGIEAVLIAMKKFPDHIYIQEWGIGALLKLIGDGSRGTQRIAHECDALASISQAMKSHSDYDGVQQAGCKAIQVLLRGKKAQDLLLSSGQNLVAVANAAEAQINPNPAIKEAYMSALLKLLKPFDEGYALASSKSCHLTVKREFDHGDDSSDDNNGESTMGCSETRVEDSVFSGDDDYTSTASALGTLVSSRGDYNDDPEDRMEEFDEVASDLAASLLLSMTSAKQQISSFLLV